jgi:hypothetical protein
MPHNCGVADSLIVVDVSAKSAWFAQMRGTGVGHWPDLATWPAFAREQLKGIAR